MLNIWLLTSKIISIHCGAELIPYQIAGGSRNWNWHHHFPFIVWLVKKNVWTGGKLKNYRVIFFFVAKYVIRVFLVSQKLFYWFIINIGIFLRKLICPTVRKNCSSDREKLLKFGGWRPRICKIFKVTWTIYSNSERSEQVSEIF